MEEVKVFENPEFGSVRTIAIDGEPWFTGKDVAAALGYRDTKNALKAHVESEDKRGWQITTPSGKQNMTVINESGLYALIFGSRLPSARKFKRWVTSEVLPAIRKTGSYGERTEKLMEITEQLTQAAVMIVQATSSITQSVNRLIDAVDRLSAEKPDEKQISEIECGKRFVNPAYYQSRCKIETFPREITEQVNEMLESMLEQQNLNFSMIARFCTVNGYSISQPSVKRYFQKNFVNE